MSVLGNLLSQVMYSDEKTAWDPFINPSAIVNGIPTAVDTSVTVSVKFYGLVTYGTTTYVRVDTLRTGRQDLGDWSANTTVTFNLINTAGESSSVYATDGRSGQLVLSCNSFLSKIESIRVVASASINNVGGFVSVTANVDKTVYVSYCASPYVIVNSLEGDNKFKHIYLPIMIKPGYVMHIKNVSKEFLCVHAQSNLIEDGINARIVASMTTPSGLINECGFIMRKNEVCTLLYDGTCWRILSYFSGLWLIQ
jgi:hypothetical protein